MRPQVKYITSDEEMGDVMKIVKSLEESDLLTKEQKGGFLSMFIGTLDASLLRGLLTGKGVKKSNLPGPEVIEQAKE